MILLEIAAAWAYSHVLEYYAHRFLHCFTKKQHPLSFHMRDHHVKAWRNEMHDTLGYKEIFGLIVLAAVHSPLLLVSPAAYITLCACALSYLIIHWKAHTDPEWAFKYLQWHVDHHLGNQQANWGVRMCWVDHLLGTRDGT